MSRILSMATSAENPVWKRPLITFQIIFRRLYLNLHLPRSLKLNNLAGFLPPIPLMYSSQSICTVFGDGLNVASELVASKSSISTLSAFLILSCTCPSLMHYAGCTGAGESRTGDLTKIKRGDQPLSLEALR